jgi:hypothetical protein
MMTSSMDPATELAHKLIRRDAMDAFDPFMVHGHPDRNETSTRIVRACFYYAMVVTPVATVLYDNDGKGGMCEMVDEEIRAIWRTKDLLDTLSTTFACLQDGTAIIPTDIDIPEANWSLNQEVGPKFAP